MVSLSGAATSNELPPKRWQERGTLNSAHAADQTRELDHSQQRSSTTEKLVFVTVFTYNSTKFWTGLDQIFQGWQTWRQGQVSLGLDSRKQNFDYHPSMLISFGSERPKFGTVAHRPEWKLVTGADFHLPRSCRRNSLLGCCRRYAL